MSLQMWLIDDRPAPARYSIFMVNTPPAPDRQASYASLLAQPRFSAPAKWDWNTRSFGDIKIRYGQTRDKRPFDGVVAIWGGLRDFGEQYFELAHDLLDRNLKPIIIDLPGQGGSTHYLPNSHKRHSRGFEEALTQLSTIMDETVLSAAVVHDDNHKRLPVILLAHSFGGHLALRYLRDHNRNSKDTPIVCAAALCAPMMKIKAVEGWPPPLAFLAAKLLSLRPTAYVPGGTDWHENYRNTPALRGLFSSDPERGLLQEAYFNTPAYQHLVTGSPTTKWLWDAIQSCRKIGTSAYLKKIECPVLIGLAENDGIVSNAAIRSAAKLLPKGHLVEIPGAQHEILMECDSMRRMFLDQFFTFIDQNVLNGPNKGRTFIL